jgi:hypothetical protein
VEASNWPWGSSWTQSCLKFALHFHIAHRHTGQQGATCGATCGFVTQPSADQRWNMMDIRCSFSVQKPGDTLRSTLVGGLEDDFYFSTIYGIILPIDFQFFQRGGSTTNQLRSTKVVSFTGNQWLIWVCQGMLVMQHFSPWTFGNPSEPRWKAGLPTCLQGSGAWEASSYRCQKHQVRTSRCSMNQSIQVFKVFYTYCYIDELWLLSWRQSIRWYIYH